MTQQQMRKEFLQRWANAQDGLFHAEKGNYRSFAWSPLQSAAEILQEMFPDVATDVLDGVVETLDEGAVWVWKRDYGLL